MIRAAIVAIALPLGGCWSMFDAPPPPPTTIVTPEAVKPHRAAECNTRGDPTLNWVERDPTKDERRSDNWRREEANRDQAERVVKTLKRRRAICWAGLAAQE